MSILWILAILRGCMVSCGLYKVTGVFWSHTKQGMNPIKLSGRLAYFVHTVVPLKLKNKITCNN